MKKMTAFWKASKSILGGFWFHLGTQGGSPEMLVGCPEGSWGHLGAKMVPRMIPRGPKRPPDDPKTDFDQILIDFYNFFGRFVVDF